MDIDLSRTKSIIVFILIVINLSQIISSQEDNCELKLSDCPELLVNFTLRRYPEGNENYVGSHFTYGLEINNIGNKSFSSQFLVPVYAPDGRIIGDSYDFYLNLSPGEICRYRPLWPRINCSDKTFEELDLEIGWENTTVYTYPFDTDGAYHIVVNSTEPNKKVLIYRVMSENSTIFEKNSHTYAFDAMPRWERDSRKRQEEYLKTTECLTRILVILTLILIVLTLVLISLGKKSLKSAELTSKTGKETNELTAKIIKLTEQTIKAINKLGRTVKNIEAQQRKTLLNSLLYELEENLDLANKFLEYKEHYQKGEWFHVRKFSTRTIGRVLDEVELDHEIRRMLHSLKIGLDTNNGFIETSNQQKKPEILAKVINNLEGGHRKLILDINERVTSPKMRKKLFPKKR